jgi:short-subunit dehydrogenase
MQLSCEQADTLIAGARAKAKAIGIAVSVAILDSAGPMKAFSRMDGAWLGSSDVALRKARTSTVRVEKLDLLDPYDVARGCEWDFDILVNNAGVGEGGPIAEIHLDLVRRNFEVNVFAPLALTQRVVKNWVASGMHGKIVFVSSMGGLFSPPGFSAYAATKHALEAIAEAMQEEMRPSGIQVQTINPGAYLTGFNEAMAENAFRWLDDAVNFTKRDMMRGMANGLIGNEQGRLDPSDMIAKMVEVIPAGHGKFRNIHPKVVEDSLRSHQAEMF